MSHTDNSVMRILSKIKYQLTNHRAKQKNSIKLYMAPTLWLSLGENCLSDNILHRHGKKSFSTPYSHGRSNLDYAISLEKMNYSGLLDKENLKYDHVGKSSVVRSTLFNKSDDIFSYLHINGFEFTHHDILSSDKERESLQRKIQRLNKYRNNKRIVFLYHHRICNNSNLDSLFQKGLEFLEFYKKNSCLIIFSQKIVQSKDERKLHYKRIQDNIHFFQFDTMQLWEGDEEDILWAKIDDDLVKQMIDHANIILTSRSK